MVNGNIWPNSAPSRDIRHWNPSERFITLTFQGHSGSSVMVSLDSLLGDFPGNREYLGKSLTAYWEKVSFPWKSRLIWIRQLPLSRKIGQCLGNTTLWETDVIWLQFSWNSKCDTVIVKHYHENHTIHRESPHIHVTFTCSYATIFEKVGYRWGLPCISLVMHRKVRHLLLSIMSCLEGTSYVKSYYIGDKYCVRDSISDFDDTYMNT